MNGLVREELEIDANGVDNRGGYRAGNCRLGYCHLDIHPLATIY